MKKVGIALIVSLILVSVFVTPVMAMGPKKSKSGKVILVEMPKDKDCYIIVSKRGWRQWRADIDRFAICLFTEGMNDQAIQSHLDDGWLSATISTGDPRYQYLADYVDGDDPIGIIYKYHDIPAE